MMNQASPAGEPRLSLVIPFYNEAARFEKTLPEIKRFAESFKGGCELLLVDDGSIDASASVITQHLAKTAYHLLKNPVNQGKGSAVRQGMLAAKGRFVLFSDADLSTPLSEVLSFLPHLESGYDLVIGSRALSESHIELHQNLIREGMGKVFNLLARCLAFQDIRDSQCGFKCFSRKAAQALFSIQKLNGFAFDAEILYIAQKRGYRILEKPVRWRNEPQSRVHVFLDPLRMFTDLCKIRWIHRKTI